MPPPPPPTVAGVKEAENASRRVSVTREVETQQESFLRVKRSCVPSLPCYTRKLNGRGLPLLGSLAGVDGISGGGLPLPFVSSATAAVGFGMGVVDGRSPVCQNARDTECFSTQDRVSDFLTAAASATDVVGGDGVVVPNSPSVSQDNLLRPLQELSHNRDGIVGETGYSAEKKGGDAGHYVDVDDALDDLFAHVFSVLEDVVHKYLFHSLVREWKSRSCRNELLQPSVSKEYDRLWSLAQRQDEEAWIAWKSALCRSWRRTRREFVSRERSEVLAITLFQLNPLRSASPMFTRSASPNDLEKLQDERHKTRAKLYALIGRVLYTCPAIFIDQHTKRLAAAAKIELDFLRKWTLETKQIENTEENIIGFIHKLDHRESDEIDDAELTNLEEVERLFAAERRGLLRLFDAGQLPPPSRVVAPVSPFGPPLSTATFASPSLYSSAQFRRHVDPSCLDQRLQTATALDWSPIARNPLEMEMPLATRFASSPDEQMYPIATAKVKHEAPGMKLLAGAGSRSVVCHQGELKRAKTSCSPHVRILDAELSLRQLPSTLKSPRSLSSW